MGTDSKSAHIVLTCEHGGNRVPARYHRLFAGQRRLLATHRGYDIGALNAARFLSRRLDAPLVSATVTRLVVDLNRSIGHPRAFSEFSRPLPAEERERIVADHYRPYRDEVRRRVSKGVADGRLLHLSVHSFTPVLDGVERRADIGLLYDPSRADETRLAREWRAALFSVAPDLRVRSNYPYRGVSDGLIPALRREFAPSRYIGIEIEINQRWATGEAAPWRYLLDAIVRTLPLPGRRR
jgi:predicted N-formylglutamate amidohydrolase